MSAAVPRLRYETLGALLDAAIPLRDFLVEPWLKQGESALLYAAPGAGKSMLTQTLAIAVAGGGEFMGWKCATPRRVLFIDGEMNRADLQDRAKALLHSVRGTNVDDVRKNLVFLARQSQHPDTEFPDLATPEGQQSVIRHVQAGKFDLLILDNFSTLVTARTRTPQRHSTISSSS